MINSIVYIDASNLKFGIKQSNWELDYKVFRSWLRDKFCASRAILLKQTNVPIVILDDFIEKLKSKMKKPPDMP